MRAPSYAHLAALTDHHGIFEHARYDVPRRRHAYCVDDAARALILVSREPDGSPELNRLAEIYLRLLERALNPERGSHNRMSTSGRFTDLPETGDWWGRATWAFGEVRSSGVSADHRDRSERAFAVAASQRSPSLRAMVFAGLGAAAVLDADPGDERARALLRDSAAAVTGTTCDEWAWPEARLTYANGAIPELLLRAGAALGRDDLVARGLELLRFLLAVETVDDRLSVSGTGGRGPEDRSPLYDQQPIEVAAIAEACRRAFDITADAAWLVGVERAWGWFQGRNDARVVMFDASVGAGFDGLQPGGRNENRGAESTIAALMTHQLARRLGVLNAERVVATTGGGAVVGAPGGLPH